MKCPICGRQGYGRKAEHEAIDGWNEAIARILQRDQAAANALPLIGTPKAGYYGCRLSKHAVEVAVRIWFGSPIFDGEELDRSPRWCCEVDGETTRIEHDNDGNPIGHVLFDVFEYWPICCGTPISEKEYRHRLRRRAWALEHDPDHPAANPRRPIDVRTMKPGW